ncbi:MAG: alpha-ribazole phosphatase [Chloroflexi bacterium]|nr:MAG: alpha-ribazole phosphatase [Chloroflexota bacterium]
MVEVKIGATTAKSSEEQNTRRLWLVRHGLTEWNTQQRFCGHSDIPLSARGRVQARWLARRLREEAITLIYTSDLARARETAEIIASLSTQAVPLKVSTAWREIDFGAWEGLTYAEIAEQFKDQLGFFTDPEQCSPPGGESLAHMLQRVMAELAAIARSDDRSIEGDVVIVSHGGPLRVLLCSMLGMPLERQWQIRLDPGSLSAIDLLPIHEPWTPQAILALLNVHGSTGAAKGARTEATSGSLREEGAT